MRGDIDNLVPASAPVMAAEADVLVADGSHLLLDFRRIPDIVLIGNGDEVGGGTHGRCLEVGIEAQVMLIQVHFHLRMSGFVFFRNLHRPVRRTVVLDDKLSDGVGLQENGIELFSEVLLSVIGTDNHRDRLVRFFCAHKCDVIASKYTENN